MVRRPRKNPDARVMIRWITRLDPIVCAIAGMVLLSPVVALFHLVMLPEANVVA